MRMGRKKIRYTPDDAKVEKGLDPRSLYPRCDFCSKTKENPGDTQMGRWWAHAACAALPSNQRLDSTKLKPVDYRIVRTYQSAGQKVHAMRTKVNIWIASKKAQLRAVADEVGDSLSMYERTEYI